MKFGVGAQTVDNWRREFEWDRRLQNRNEKISDYVEDKAVMLLGDAKLKFLEIAHTTIDKYVKQLERDEVILTPSEFERIVRLAMFLYDQPDSRREIVTVDAVDKAIRELEEELDRITNP
jgi:transposase